MERTKHIPVLLQVAVESLKVAPGQVVVDATLGGGGYTRELLARVGPSGQVIALDVDEAAIARFREYEGERENLVLKKANFSHLSEVLTEAGIEGVDAIVADLGFSSDQMDDPQRGLSFQKDGPLDMRLDQSRGKTARDILAEATEEELRAMLRQNDESEARAIARAIVQARATKPLETTRELALLVEQVYPKRARVRMGIHPATRTFQALRIAVNEEMEHLKQFLSQAVMALRPGGRLALVTFHSGEDTLVKSFFRTSAHPCVCPKNFPACICKKQPTLRIVTTRAVKPTEDEKKVNPRSRSAHLRVAEKL